MPGRCSRQAAINFVREPQKLLDGFGCFMLKDLGPAESRGSRSGTDLHFRPSLGIIPNSPLESIPSSTHWNDRAKYRISQEACPSIRRPQRA